ncbi:MAG: HAD-IIIA family hydrolase [Planctomycetes bacterium]|nr:HAD-IIIA family hydrolase [Planctomycetota bacterium]
MAKPLSEIRMLVLDVDGVLTDAGVYIAADGSDTKRFSIKDGFGIKIAMQAGLGVAIISGHASEATVHRFRGLGVEEVIVGATDKTGPFNDLLQRHGLEARQVAAMGDDLPDLPLLRAAGFAATVPDAPEEVRDAADLVTQRRGGDGAVREVIECILKAQNRWNDVVARFAP